MTGVTVSIGHSHCDLAQAEKAVDKGTCLCLIHAFLLYSPFLAFLSLSFISVRSSHCTHACRRYVCHSPIQRLAASPPPKPRSITHTLCVPSVTAHCCIEFLRLVIAVLRLRCMSVCVHTGPVGLLATRRKGLHSSVAVSLSFLPSVTVSLCHSLS